MLRLLAGAQKLRGRSVRDLGTRAAQALHAHAERRGVAGHGWEPNDGLPTLWQHDAGHFFPGLSDRRATTLTFAERWPDAAGETRRRADAIASGVLDVFGRELHVGASPDWQVEPCSGVRAPAVHWSKIAFLDPHVAGDCKFTWEINRHQ